MSTEEVVLLEIKDKIATLTLNRPDKYNSLRRSMASPMLKALKEASKARVLIIKGSGKAFCAGQDLEDPGVVWVEKNPPDLAAQMDELYSPVFEALSSFPAPVITAVQGVAAGAGMALALWGDFVIATPKAEFHPAFGKVGLAPDSGLTWLLPQLVGWRRSREILLLGEKIPAEKAKSWGLISEVTEQLDETVNALALKLVVQAPGALRATKKLLGAQTMIQNTLLQERHYQAVRGRSKDFDEGVRAFKERRAPQFEEV